MCVTCFFFVTLQAVAEAAHMHMVMTESGVTVFLREGGELASVGPKNAWPHPGLFPTSADNVVVVVGTTNSGGRHGSTLLHATTGQQQLKAPQSLSPVNQHKVAAPSSSSSSQTGGGGSSTGSSGGGGGRKFLESETTALGQWVSERNIYRIISEVGRGGWWWLPVVSL